MVLYMFHIWLVQGYHFFKVQPNIEESKIEGAHCFFGLRSLILTESTATVSCLFFVQGVKWVKFSALRSEISVLPADAGMPHTVTWTPQGQQWHLLDVES